MLTHKWDNYITSYPKAQGLPGKKTQKDCESLMSRRTELTHCPLDMTRPLHLRAHSIRDYGQLMAPV